MPSLFLSHTSSDKPFVEKLAKDLKKCGIKVWFDKWEIKVGDSLLWKIEEGIRENEYLAVILSPESLRSNWVKHELSAAFAKQMQTKRIVLLPILYQDCEIPLFLEGCKYADFRNDYEFGFRELACALGINDNAIISVENWRNFVRKKNVYWRSYKEQEFEQLVTALIDRALEYKWFAWVGGRKSFSITLSARLNGEIKKSVSIRIDGKTNLYVGSFVDEINPNRLLSNDYTVQLGKSINQCEEFAWRQMEDFRRLYGDPEPDPEKAYHQKFLSSDEKIDSAIEMMKKMSWYKGDKLWTFPSFEK